MNPGHTKLPRLSREMYRGFTAVHWIFTTKDRAAGWLDAAFHAHFREMLGHTGVRYGCVSPVYCLMPDHIHLMLLGIRSEAGLYLAGGFLRKHTASALQNAQFQKQPYDHVLRENEREHDAFPAICHYIAENPVRAGLCDEPEDYTFSGCVVPGYPDLCIHDEDYWDVFWKIYHRITS